MPRTVLAAVIFVGLMGIGAMGVAPTGISPVGSAWANPSMWTTQSPGEQCRSAIAAAERGHAIPPQLMAAIGRVESGRRDPGTGAWGAWPWTINAEGQGYYFDTKAEAIAAVRGLQAQGVRSIDVGCMQVNLMHHPDAFPNLDVAFEPATNADYAARFLVDLRGQTGDWTKATANYHSANPAEGGPYAAKVTSVWPEEQRKAGLTPLPLVGAGFGSFARGVPPVAGRQPPRMYAMAGKPAFGMMPTGMMPTGTMPTGTINREASPGGVGMKGGGPVYPLIAPAGMMRGGTMPVGTLPTGSVTNGEVTRVPATAPTAAASPLTINPGRGLAFYRAMPIAVMAATPRSPARPGNKITTR
jgi:hypothetical protein